MLWAILIILLLTSMSLQYFYPDKEDLRREIAVLRGDIADLTKIVQNVHLALEEQIAKQEGDLFEIKMAQRGVSVDD